LPEKVKDDKYSFLTYARSNTKSKAQVGPLRDICGRELNAAGAIDGEVFNIHFSSLFTAEDDVISQ